MSSPRSAIIKDGYALMPYFSKGSIGYSKIDVEDVWLDKYSWCLNDAGYLVSGYRKDGVSKLRRLHRVVMNTPSDLATDHINGDKLDNRRQNLRVCLNRYNTFNRGYQRNNKSGYKGVSWSKTCNKWLAQISINGRRTYLGVFDNIKQAASAYDKAAKAHHGEFARLNSQSKRRVA